MPLEPPDPNRRGARTAVSSSRVGFQCAGHASASVPSSVRPNGLSDLGDDSFTCWRRRGPGTKAEHRLRRVLQTSHRDAATAGNGHTGRATDLSEISALHAVPVNI